MILKERVGRWVSGMMPAELFSRLVILGATAEFGLGQLASPYLTASSRLLNGASFVLTALASFGFLAMVYVSLRHRVPDDAMRTVLLISVALSDALCGALLAWARYAVGLDPTALWVLRITSTVVNVGAASILLWMAASGIRRHYQRLDALITERDRLEALRTEARQELDALNEDATEAVRSRILHDLKRTNELDAHSMLAALTTTIEHTVRPLSRQLELAAPSWTPPEPRRRVGERINWAAVLFDGTSVKWMNPLALLLILSVIAAPMNTYRVGWAFAVEFAVLTFVVAVPVYKGIRWLFVQIFGDAEGMLRVLSFIAMCVLSGLAWGLVTLLITWDSPMPLRFVFLCPAFTLIYGYILGVAFAAQDQARATEEALRDATSDLRWNVSRKRELHRQRKRALAQAVHGRVQAALAAGILEIERELQTGAITDEKIRSVHARIASCVHELDLQENAPLNLNRIADKVRATWAGVVELSLSIDSALESALVSDIQALITLNDVIPELVFNSIKHGKASQVGLELKLADERSFQLICADNGTAEEISGSEGLGSRLLDTCTMHWSRARMGNRTVTTLLLPLATGDAAPTEGFPLESKVCSKVSS